ncbi:hypothetical protein [Enterococcus columbae]|uniref:Uncharacterized protein n=1 Tax=Enterococcus columbae DSM 7374 = ATCC 51263 TaxID=1121865 RepID=S0KYR1_9ENTE|nr:hypothetical protein [Enterococcus columbae]EOT44391.1 hypothetical protein OMW_00447 [Enterococcus columbae DSM 7374 = ATCC 51263]EOW84549.1 hypothetical protein I568_01045 [Enterococcus columbae DSM 7374 = ATCC 51263]
MNKKVSLKEIVGTKIFYAVILVSYYWMWARSDWKEWYSTLESLLGFFFFCFYTFQRIRIRKYKREGVDELAEQNLKRCDSICLKVFIVAMVIAAWAAAAIGHVNIFGAQVIGWWIVLSILAITILRTVLFLIMDNKGV